MLPLGVILKYWKGCKLIYDTHELESETNSLNNFKKKFAKGLEKLLIRRADKIFCVSDEISEWYSTTYKLSKPTTILNSPLLEDLPVSSYLRDKFDLREDQKIAIYLGFLEPGRGIELIVDAFHKRSSDEIVAIFIGSGSLVDYLTTSPSYGRTIFYHPSIPRREIASVASSADVGLCLVRPSCLSYSYCMPNKLFEYLMSGLPVIVTPCTSLINFVGKHQIGFVLNDLSSDFLNEKLDEIIDSDLNAIKLRSRKVFQRFSWETQALKLRSEYLKLFA